MSESLGQAYVEVRGDMSHLPADLNKIPEALHHVGQKFSLGATVGGIAEIGAGFAMAYAPIRLIEGAMERWNENAREAVHEAEALSLAQRKLQAILQTAGNTTGQTSAEMMEFAEEIQNATGASAIGIIEMQAKLVQFQSLGPEAFKRAREAAVDWATVMGHDVAGAGQMLGRALTDPARGALTLRRAGVVLSTQQEELVKRLVATGQAAKAQAVILDVLEAKYKGAAEKMATPITRLKGQLASANEELGKILREREPFKISLKIQEVRFQTGVSDEVNKFFRSAIDLAEIFGPEIAAKLKETEQSRKMREQYNAMARPAGLPEMSGSVSRDMGRATFNSMMGAMNPAFQIPGVIRNLFGLNDYEDAKKKQKELDDKGKERAAMQRGKGGKDPTEGIFEPLELQKKIQEGLLNKQGAMLDVAQQSKKVLEDILTETRNGNGGGGLDDGAEP